jgi:hypothetical protein
MASCSSPALEEEKEEEGRRRGVDNARTHAKCMHPNQANPAHNFFSESKQTFKRAFPKLPQIDLESTKDLTHLKMDLQPTHADLSTLSSIQSGISAGITTVL